MTARELAIKKIEAVEKKQKPITSTSNLSLPKHFGQLVFNKKTMQKMLPAEIYQNVVLAMEGRGKINPSYADTIALAMKEWAVSHGATHYCHLFLPLTGTTAEKHDSFLDWKGSEVVLEKFYGKELIKGEPDASSFPSGGLRNTYEARGYTSWDPSSPSFLWKSGETTTLCIPSVFFSWKGEVLDTKIPLLRADEKLREATLRLLKITGMVAENVYSTLGCEQEYFVIDQAFYHLRQDLVLLGKTVFGAPSAKGQELCDHYFGSVKQRVLSFMQHLEEEALKLGILLKTRHNEVAPSQYEVASFFERSSLAVDHNVLLMKLMERIAEEHSLKILLHEKPFDQINGSGKHLNWSLCTDTGINLLDPTESPQNTIHFLILLAAILQAVYRHGTLLRASIGSHGNDYRLGGHEAPPSILSVYLGEALEEVVEAIIESKEINGKNLQRLNLNIQSIPEMPIDQTDRNRTSPFAFTGNKFEFRAMGSSMSPAFPITVINAIVAESLNEILDEVEASLPDMGPFSSEGLYKASLPILKRLFKQSSPVRFSGDNYDLSWQKEAKKRGLSKIDCCYHSYDSMLEEPAQKAFQGILSWAELQSKCEVLKEAYLIKLGMEIKLMKEIFSNQILPSALEYQKKISKNILQLKELGVAHFAYQEDYLNKLSLLIDQALEIAAAFPQILLSDQIEPCKANMIRFRKVVDQLEMIIDNQLWTLPKYWEMLFIL